MLEVELEEEDEEDEEFEYEMDFEEEFGGIVMIKFVFVLKLEWDMIVEWEKLEVEEEVMKDLLKKKLEERKIEMK